MTHVDSNTPPTDDLDWLAFCYLAGELDDKAAADFEAQLETNQAAREALAGAMALSQSIADTGTSVVPAVARPASRIRWRQAIAWTTAAAAIFLAASWYLGQFDALDNADATGAQLANGDLANTWAEILDESPIDEADETHDANDVTDSEIEFPSDEPGVAPDWLLVALGGPDLPADSQNEATPEGDATDDEFDLFFDEVEGT